MLEVERPYRGHLESALADNTGKLRPIFATMRHTVVYDRREDWEVPVKAAMRQLGQFENLFKNLGDVADAFPGAIDLSGLENRDEYDPHMLHRNLLFGTPDEVIAKLREGSARQSSRLPVTHTVVVPLAAFKHRNDLMQREIAHGHGKDGPPIRGNAAPCLSPNNTGTRPASDTTSASVTRYRILTPRRTAGISSSHRTGVTTMRGEAGDRRAGGDRRTATLAIARRARR